MKLVKLSEHHYVLVDDTNKELYTVPISQAKELLGVVDVEKKAWKYNPVNKLDAEFIRAAYICGYNEALEDNKKKVYTEEDMVKAIRMARKGDDEFGESGFIRHGFDYSEKDVIQSLQPQTEWEVEMVDSKLKLKS